ncbi:hypothetical protein, partial [Xanthomonas fragariae]|uniref:hypothetical protein n=1 Tax=Xanthomonas fragariae TaxID=48664 RepID=UPI00131EED50
MDDHKLQQQLNELRQFIEAHKDVQHLLDNSAAWADTQREQDEKSKAQAWRVAAELSSKCCTSLCASMNCRS